VLPPARRSISAADLKRRGGARAGLLVVAVALALTGVASTLATLGAALVVVGLVAAGAHVAGALLCLRYRCAS
jgi:hypothetical protein